MLTKDLNEFGFFEGTEKLLEIWFENSEGISEFEEDLRLIPRHELDKMLDIVEAKIVSSASNEYIDAYVLSESSMFISKNRIILKTCGITRLLDSIEHIIRLAKAYTGLSKIENFFYSRRSYLRPEEQQDQHKSFTQETQFIQRVLKNDGGCAYELGNQKGEEWYLFTLDTCSDGMLASGDVTLEILMSDLNEDVMHQFTMAQFKDSQELANSTGVSKIIPGSVHDGLVFDPIGYSMNGLYQESYHTIHVTPQPMCSYVSFETNLKQRNYSSLINRVVKVFQPRKFIITLISNENALCGKANTAVAEIEVDGYRLGDQQDGELKNYSISYQHYAQDQPLYNSD